ncbi:putative Stress enhanced protein 1 [Tripterygium wilfordii]|uniref:Putative Stress enhanced protein 1 n=2 Tax=Tripterygium wilfordii TaxID=458696 RepID=A0A7J7DXR0_TRIWF|nr:putative Stress enhanced protein 1 [Tripterygium wilfordii]
MALAQLSAPLSLSTHDVCSFRSVKTLSVSGLPNSSFGLPRNAFVTGFPLLICKTVRPTTLATKATSLSIRCEQSTKGSSFDVWLGRLAMVGFAAAISVEIATGKGLLENFGLTSPLPTVALAVTALVGILTAVFIFQSASKS